MKIGVFDSGIGGEAIARSISDALPTAEVIVVNDKEHLPYGDRTGDDIIGLTDTAIQPLLESRCDIIVIACNSATAAAIDWLRAHYPDQKFIGLEPMVKTASQITKSGIITICATPATLGSSRYKALRTRFGAGKTFLEPDCHTWAQMIESNEMTRQTIITAIEPAIAQGSDVIVLACTHYHWIREEIEDIVGDKAVIIDPSEAIVKRIIELVEPQPQQ